MGLTTEHLELVLRYGLVALVVWCGLRAAYFFGKGAGIKHAASILRIELDRVDDDDDTGD